MREAATLTDTIIVTPVFEDRVAATRLFVDLAAVFGPGGVRVIAVDDGSIRDPLPAKAISDAGLDGSVIRLIRNVGHQRAIATGLAHVRAHHPEVSTVVVMDSDGEDRPDSIPQLIAVLADGDCDVVVAQRRARSESLGFRLFYAVYRLLFWLFTGRSIRFGNFMAMRSAGLVRLTSMGELGMHVAGSVLLSRLRWRGCPIDRGHRYAGRSQMNFVGLALHGFKGLMVFAEDVLVRVGAGCALVAGSSLLGITAAVVLKSIGYATPGWFSVALGILLLIFIQTGAITLMTLLLTGVSRNSLVLPADHGRLVAGIDQAGSAE